MNPKVFNGRFRPLVNKAWEAQSRRLGLSTADKAAKETWYRGTLENVLHKQTTKGLSDAEQRHLLETMTMIAEMQHEVPVVHGWTKAQNECFAELALAAWDKSGGRDDKAFHHWLEVETGFHGIAGWTVIGKAGRTTVFDRVMAHLACIADNDYWLRRTAAQEEIRLRWQIRQLLKDLDDLDWTETHTWAYVKGIWKQSGSLPADMNDAPAETLKKVYQMLDTHVRRIADKSGIDQQDLHSRKINREHVPVS